MFQRPEDRMTAVAAAERQRTKAIAEHRRQSAATSRQALGVTNVRTNHTAYSLEPPCFNHLDEIVPVAV